MVVNDSFQNVLARLGYGTPNLMEGTQYPLTRLTNDYQLINSLYRSHWIIRRVVDTIPEDMTRNWITINTETPPGQIKKIDRLWRSRRLKQKVLHGLKWGRLYGGAVGLIVIAGHDDIMDQPLDYDTIMPGGLKNIMIVDRWTGAYPSGDIVQDINDIEFGLPQFYEITLDGGRVLRVHHSRVLRFTGRKLPYWEEMAEVGWGASEIEIVFDELKKRDNVSWNIAQLTFLANLRVYKMGDLGSTLALNDDQSQQDLYNTVQAQNWLMSNMGLNIIDANDSFETHQYTFAGLNDIYQSFMMDVSGAASMPVTKLFGRSPAGMNATGESDLQNYYEVVEQRQEADLTPILDKLLPIMCMSELGAIPDDLDYTFNPVQSPDDKEIADLVQQKTAAIVSVVNAGILSQKTALLELKQLGDTTGMFTNITDEQIAQADDSTSQGEVIPDDAFGSLGATETNRTRVPSSRQKGADKAPFSFGRH
jgi:phage-related protein (TIGR01555 family)